MADIKVTLCFRTQQIYIECSWDYFVCKFGSSKQYLFLFTILV